MLKDKLWDERERCWGAGKEGLVTNYRIKVETKTKNIQPLHKAAHSYTEGNCAQQIVVLNCLSPPERMLPGLRNNKGGGWRSVG